MPYKETLDVVDPWRSVLDTIHANAQRNEATIIQTDFPKETRWQIYQAVHASKVLGIEPFNKLTLRIKKHSDKVLIIYTKLDLSSIPISLHSESNFTPPKAIHGCSSLVSIVTASLKESAQLISFPDLEPSLIEKASLWANQMNHEIVNLNPFTIRKKQ